MGSRKAGFLPKNPPFSNLVNKRNSQEAPAKCEELAGNQETGIREKKRPYGSGARMNANLSKSSAGEAPSPANVKQAPGQDDRSRAFAPNETSVAAVGDRRGGRQEARFGSNGPAAHRHPAVGPEMPRHRSVPMLYRSMAARQMGVGRPGEVCLAGNTATAASGRRYAVSSTPNSQPEDQCQ